MTARARTWIPAQVGQGLIQACVDPGTRALSIDRAIGADGNGRASTRSPTHSSWQQRPFSPAIPPRPHQIVRKPNDLSVPPFPVDCYERHPAHMPGRHCPVLGRVVEGRPPPACRETRKDLPPVPAPGRLHQPRHGVRQRSGIVVHGLMAELPLRPGRIEHQRVGERPRRLRADQRLLQDVPRQGVVRPARSGRT